MITRNFYVIPLLPSEENVHILKMGRAISSTGIRKEKKICVWIHRDSFRRYFMKDRAFEFSCHSFNKPIFVDCHLYSKHCVEFEKIKQ